jgi:hypothetical protein
MRQSGIDSPVSNLNIPVDVLTNSLSDVQLSIQREPEKAGRTQLLLSSLYTVSQW